MPVVLALSASGQGNEKEEKSMSVSDGKKVSIEYTVKLDDGNVADSNVGQDPLTFVVGEGQIIPGLEAALDGMQAGDSKQVEVPPDQAYGPVQQEAVLTVPLEELPDEVKAVGKQVQAQGQDGRKLEGVVREVAEQSAIIDFNHPLAGKSLFFDVKVLAVENP